MAGGAWPDAEGHEHRIKDIRIQSILTQKTTTSFHQGQGIRIPGRLQNSSRVKGPDPGGERPYTWERFLRTLEQCCLDVGWNQT